MVILLIICLCFSNLMIPTLIDPNDKPNFYFNWQPLQMFFSLLYLGSPDLSVDVRSDLLLVCPMLSIPSWAEIREALLV